MKNKQETPLQFSFYIILINSISENNEGDDKTIKK